ncbi:HNH endonuclease [Paraburkholderia franconis]|uniref:HNH endonuclease n=1 Tax=Paraburkholderia franconis TaxID=2654983 RepID=UPI00389951F8
MWDGNAGPFIELYELSRRQALQLQCTAEHLHARADGGVDCQRNIVAACRVCNARRHHRKVARNPSEHRMHVQRCVNRGKWHANWVFDNPALATACQHSAQAGIAKLQAT